MTKKEEACVKHHDVKEEKKAKRFDKFMAAMEKKIKLEEKRVELGANSDDTKMLTLKMENLHPDPAKLVQAYRARVFKCLVAELE